MAQIGEILIGIGGDSKPLERAIIRSQKLLVSFVNEVEKGGKKIEDVTYGWIGTQVRWGTEVGKAYTKIVKSLDPVKQGLYRTR